MTATEWDRVISVFGDASELPAAERPAFLDSRCGDDVSLRAAVERLLTEHDRTAGPLDRPLFSADAGNSEDVWSGRVLNSRYRIERFLARGGMSTVYLARDQQLAGKPVIVKFLHAWARQYAWLKARFRQEMEALARIDHHAVVGVLDTGETADGLPFLVIEYVDGVTLRTEIARGPIALHRTARILRETGRAVDAAHRKGVLHRDLKPENIMLEQPGTPEERVRLIDFGIARMEEATEAAATQLTQFAGTTHYMAPEQLRGKPCPASDIYALAVVAYEMLAGERPFVAVSPVDMYEQQRAGAKVSALVRRGVSETAARLIGKQLSFRAEDRVAPAALAAEQIADALLRPDRRVWSRRCWMAGLASGTAIAAGSGYGLWKGRSASLEPAERVIEWPVASEPTEHGFKSRNVIENRVLPNADVSGFDSLRIITTDQGAYYHPLSDAQAAAANRLGWKLIFEAAAEEGMAGGSVDIPHAPVRWAVNITATRDKADKIELLTGFTPVIHGIEFPLEGTAGARHRYVLAWFPGQGADLSVDGVKRYSGYEGLNEYLYHRGPEFNVNRYRSARGVGVFWSFRFEIG